MNTSIQHIGWGECSAIHPYAGLESNTMAKVGVPSMRLAECRRRHQMNLHRSVQSKDVQSHSSALCWKTAKRDLLLSCDGLVILLDGGPACLIGVFYCCFSLSMFFHFFPYSILPQFQTPSYIDAGPARLVNIRQRFRGGLQANPDKGL